jgi:hypothetical protein
MFAFTTPLPASLAPLRHDPVRRGVIVTPALFNGARTHQAAAQGAP